VRSYIDGISSKTGNVTVEQIAYTWETGTNFQETQELFVKIKEYVYTPLLTNPQLYINGSSATSTGGWGESFYFNATVRDRFGRNVTVFLWHKKGAADYIQIGNWTCEDCETATEANFTYNYIGGETGDIGSWTYKFNATNPDGGDETAQGTYTIEKDDIDVSYSSPTNNSIVNRSEAFNFTINVFDVDNSSVPGHLMSGAQDDGKGKIAISRTNNIDLYNAQTLATDASGNLLREMQNNSATAQNDWCDTSLYLLGTNYWYGGVSGAANYKNNLTANESHASYDGNRVFILKGSLMISYINPQDNNYTLGSQIPLQTYVIDDCNTNVSDTTVVFNLSSGIYSTTQEVKAVSNLYTNTTYTLPAAAPYGWYNVTITSNRTNYWNATFTQEDAFYYGSAINITTQNMTPHNGTHYTGGWGESPFYFNVSVSNNQTTNTSLFLWNTTNNWFLVYSEECTDENCYDYDISYARNFSCDNIGTWAFRSNSTDISGFTNNALGNITFYVEKDDIIIEHLRGNNSYVNRSEAQTGTSVRLETKINDTDAGNYTAAVNSATSFITNIYNGSSWITISESINATNISYYVDLNPGCGYEAGNHNWNMTTNSSTCFKDHSSLNFVVNVIGDLNNTISVPDGNTNYTVGNSITLNTSVIDDCLESKTGLTTLYYNISNGTYSEVHTASDEGTGYYSYVWNSTGNSSGYYNVTFYSGLDNYNNDSALVGFFLSSTQTLTSPSVSPTSGGWGVANYTYSVVVADTDGDTVNVTLWIRNATDDGDWEFYASELTTGGISYFNRSYTQNEIKNWSFKFNSTDDHGNYVESSAGSHVVDKDTITATIYEGNNTYVNRSESQTGIIVRLATYLYDVDKVANSTNVSEATFFMYLTNESGTWIEQSESINSTDPSDYYYLDFNPTCNYTAAQQLWNTSVIGDTFHKNVTSPNFFVNVIGDLNATYTSPASLSTIYERGDNIVFSGNVTDDCGAFVSGANVQYLINSSTAIYYCNFSDNFAWDETSGIYNCTWDSTGKNVTDYNVTMIVDKAFHISATDYQEDAFHIKATMGLDGAFVQPEDEGWSFNRTFYVNVTDNLGDNVTVWLWESDDEITWTQVGNILGCNETCADTTMNWTKNYSCGDIKTWYYKFNASDTEGNGYTTSGSDYVIDNNFAIEADNIRIEYIAGNETNATRDNNPATFILRVYDIDKGTYNITPAAYISFNVTRLGEGTTYYKLNTNTTNATGYVDFVFYTNTSFTVGKQNWYGFIDTSQTPSCYKFNVSGIYNVTTLSNEPVLDTQVVSPISGGWGDQRTFNITINDSQNNATVYLYKAESISGPWTFIDEQNYTNASEEVVLSFPYQATCSDLGTGGTDKIWYFKFNASNTVGNFYSTTPSASDNFTLTRDYISFEGVTGNNSIANRTDTQTDLIGIRVRDNNGSIVNGLNVTFKITRDGTNYDSGTVNQTNSTGDAIFIFDPLCSPRYEVGVQKWQGIVSGEGCYQSNSTSEYNLTIWGDITLELNKPDGTKNYTQEQLVDFLGSSVDDCSSALTLNTSAEEIIFEAFNGTATFNCNDTGPISQIGANAYSCDWVTTLLTPLGPYNTTMNATKSYYYDASITKNISGAGLFYITVDKQLESPLAIPNSTGWGVANWNFSIIASSGDPSAAENVTIHMGTAWPPGTLNECNSSVCANQTQVLCTGCQDQLVTWLRNFTYTDVGTTVYYRFKLGSTFEDVIKSVEILKDNTNITYDESQGDAGNGTTVIKDTQPQLFRFRVYDEHADTYNLATPATVVFKLLGNYPGGEKAIGTNTTNASGSVEFNFNISECDIYQDGTQVLVAEINSSETNYNVSQSVNLTVTISSPGCEDSISVYSTTVPIEAFQNQTFTVNSTITAFGSTTGTDVNVILNTTTAIGWQIATQTQNIGSVGIGAYPTASWQVNATTFGDFKLNVYANSSNIGNGTANTSDFTVRKLFPLTYVSNIPTTIETGNESLFSWACDPSENGYRVATFNLTLNTSGTKIRVSTYSGIDWVDVLHSENYNTSGVLQSDLISVLQSQINPNETGYCSIKVKNLGNLDVIIANATLKAFYVPNTTIQDIDAQIGTTSTTGIEPSEDYFNVSIRLANGEAVDRMVNVTLNITNSSGDVVNTSTNLNVNIPSLSSNSSNFTNIPTSGWAEGNYKLRAYIVGGVTDTRIEDFIFKNVTMGINSESNYMCNQTTDWFNVTVIHPFNDTIEYNVSLEIPNGWAYSGSQTFNASTQTNYTLTFNVTTDATSVLGRINATLIYSYPGVSKTKRLGKSIENNQSIPILEVVRETPKIIGGDIVFDSRLSVHNRGCGATSGSTVVKEFVSTGWTPANPSSSGEITLNSAETDLINNIITWNLGAIGINEYAVLTYQVKSPINALQTGTLNFNVSWGTRNLREDAAFSVQTFNYTSESHLEFDLTSVQQTGSYPWGEPRSAQLSKHYNYSLEVKNIGDVNATLWNVTLDIPVDCNVTYIYNNSDNLEGVWNSTTRKINWALANLTQYTATTLNFTLNCTSSSARSNACIILSMFFWVNTSSYTLCHISSLWRYSAAPHVGNT